MVLKKEEKFIEEFINLYVEKINLKFIKDKKKLRGINKKIKSRLSNYLVLFKSLNLLYKIFNKVKEKKKKEGYVFNGDFEFFLEWVFDELYKQKIINKKDYEKLRDFLTKFSIEFINVSPYFGRV